MNTYGGVELQLRSFINHGVRWK